MKKITESPSQIYRYVYKNLLTVPDKTSEKNIEHYIYLAIYPGCRLNKFKKDAFLRQIIFMVKISPVELV